ncbi:MAG: ubiquinone/menaquinone biosynthesis methyltransferase [Candidatus Woesebacteria bacterium GW2011_GWB1_43_14]|uniref:Ubiquinone/menaquinone biosynthesis methyltransferase n=1 Tax=Candidatus Woesebacteria bacterium GW2011_GWB1_43_14 TaxID=1618578 RepID=A0A0G1DI13_9BACT|nr:MAG: ubiquinone/menaquinone biosynthesis methyltransferase [Candidatus Woesebacteria bacterium GW2011_GWA1_39_11b]KKS78381.1 MAG: ubiquinone/menaquinone biosynthesis methyltransferase [Candidatus Woesebacteria bacterium GW2011_GWC1_42_9]KKS97202.1 MAG: ubiquinone/menaquinone biosynthesis methyltransferase [Candidatus Woesebacteria bacterium GW2011_GWB1_43_14]
MFNYEEIAVSMLPRRVDKVLDFGCGNGLFCKALKKMAKKVYGCDLDAELLEKARKSVKGVSFEVAQSDGKTQYKKDFFDCVYMMGVLEHVKDEKATLSEIWRVTKPGGSLCIYGINKGLFGFLDAGNIKFRFPRIHKFLYLALFGIEKYEKEFVRKRARGMQGDFTLGKKWHTHYSINDLNILLDGRFKIIRTFHFGLFVPFLLPLQFIFDIIFSKGSDVVKKLVRLDQKISNPRLSYLFIVQCQKC